MDEFAYRFLPILSVFDDEIKDLKAVRCIAPNAVMCGLVRTTSLFEVGIVVAFLAADDGGKRVVAFGVRIERDER